jgi:hypothetical protein
MLPELRKIANVNIAITSDKKRLYIEGGTWVEDV